jgi:hypothetical protein
MRRVLGLLGSVVLGTLLCGAAAGQDLPLFGYPFPLSRTDSASGEGDSRPDLATDGHGTWVAVWYGWNSLGGTIGSTDHDILVARSMNDGVTWTPPAALNTNAGSDSGNDTRPRVATDGRGTWVAAWQSFDSLDGTIGTDSDILVARSTDGGASWSAPAALNTSAGYDYLNAHDERPQVATDGLGNWLTVWESEYSFGAIGNDSDIVASRSTDGGATWTQARALNSDAGGDFRTDFAVRVATDSQGAWVAAWTSGGTDWDIEVARSSDAGAGWTWPVFLNSNAAWDGGGDLYPDLTTDGRGNWVAVWESDDVLSGAAGSDKDIFVARSMDDGATWAPPIALNTNAGSDAGDDRDPRVTTDGRGTWLAVWYSDDSLRGTIGTDTDILVARSTDGGASWSAPTVLNGGSGTPSTRSIARSGRIATSWWRARATATRGASPPASIRTQPAMLATTLLRR